ARRGVLVEQEWKDMLQKGWVGLATAPAGNRITIVTRCDDDGGSGSGELRGDAGDPIHFLPHCAAGRCATMASSRIESGTRHVAAALHAGWNRVHRGPAEVSTRRHHL